ncbi:Helix-turn-helix domain protein [Aquimixticola soesokkakensis]|uniref:Helix-turn-helix domain protein n=1 Tax=Aquimixticola soesokkakensis TaxID=1519096 RepID=A0A1Y5SBB5_9RHOB|nr:helix-turn-helix transcriptional regulator [Aquimixticola soesokkakensis]SLN36810.1 Helix-turn-helix domain protein [Aquimixticola soesokkakensis]
MHTPELMTIMVTCQSSKLEIATKAVIPHCLHMPAKIEPKLSEALRNEMTPENIGRRLMLLREAQNLKSSEMADLLDIPRTYWSRFEGGKRAITEPVAAMLVERFDVTLDFLILGRWDRLPYELAERMRAIDLAKKS